MSIDLKPEIDREAIWKRKQERTRVSNKRENKNNHTYKKGDRILVKKPGIIRKLLLSYSGPYKVVKHCRNRLITYEKSLNVFETVNVRRVHPFHEQHPTE